MVSSIGPAGSEQQIQLLAIQVQELFRRTELLRIAAKNTTAGIVNELAKVGKELRELREDFKVLGISQLRVAEAVQAHGIEDERTHAQKVMAGDEPCDEAPDCPLDKE